MQGVPGTEPATHRCLVDFAVYIRPDSPLPRPLVCVESSEMRLVLTATVKVIGRGQRSVSTVASREY